MRAVPRWAAPVTLGLTVLGLAIAVYLTIEHYDTAITLACPDRGTIDCAKVTTSAQSTLLGIPVALLGLLWFAGLVPLMLPAVWRRGPSWVSPLRVVAVAAGLPMVVYLVHAELYDVHAVCLWCTGVHVVAFLLFCAVALATALTLPAD